MIVFSGDEYQKIRNFGKIHKKILFEAFSLYVFFNGFVKKSVFKNIRQKVQHCAQQKRDHFELISTHIVQIKHFRQIFLISL